MAISYLYLFLKTTFVSFFVNDYLYQKYPEKYNEVFINISFKLLYLYSKSQILFNRINKDMIDNINHFLSRNPNINNLIERVKTSYNCFINKTSTETTDIEFISNGLVIFDGSRERVTNGNIDLPPTYDFIVCSDVVNGCQDNKVVNKKIQKSVEKNSFNYEISNISFILSEIRIGDKTIKVDFKTKDYNYYVVNNIFNDKFILYFLNKYYSSEIKDFKPETIKLFTLNVIDNNVDMYEFNKNDNVQIQKDGYIKNQ
jgi:hypothetical protein